MECFYICVHKIGNISESTHFRSSIEIAGLQSLLSTPGEQSLWAVVIWAQMKKKNKNKKQASQSMKRHKRERDPKNVKQSP